MATIFTRQSNDGRVSYYANISINGKRIRQFAGYDKDVALLHLKRIEYEAVFTKQSPSINIDKAYSSYMDYIQTTSIKPKQVKVIKRKVGWFCEYAKSNSINKLEDVKSIIANSYILSRSNTMVQSRYNCGNEAIYQKISPSTLNREIGFIKRFFSYCIDMEWIDRNPFRAIKPFRVKPNGQRYHFSPEQLDNIMENAAKFYDFYYLLLHTGIRCTDAYKLKPEHFEGNYLKVQMNKTGDFLNIPIPRHVLEVLEPRMANSSLFPLLYSDRQRRNCVKNIQRLFEPDFVRRNNINLHTFRHTYAHNMLNKGVPKEVLQTLLGHRSIKTTEIYANWVRKEELERWV
jgi:site-specific recombinase XerD